MSKSSNAVSRCATLLMACTTLASQAAQAGMIVLENQLPVPTSCVVEARYGAEFDPKGLGVLYKAQLLDTLLLPGTTHVAPVRPGQWPVQLRFDGFGAPYTVSPPFIDLELRCRVGEHEHAAVFANPDFLKGGPWSTAPIRLPAATARATWTPMCCRPTRRPTARALSRA